MHSPRGMPLGQLSSHNLASQQEHFDLFLISRIFASCLLQFAGSQVTLAFFASVSLLSRFTFFVLLSPAVTAHDELACACASEATVLLRFECNVLLPSSSYSMVMCFLLSNRLMLNSWVADFTAERVCLRLLVAKYGDLLIILPTW